MMTDTRELVERLERDIRNAMAFGYKYASTLTTEEADMALTALLRSPAERGEGETVRACPVCGGRGSVSLGFYGDRIGAYSTSALNPVETCRTCQGTTVYPPRASPPAPVEGTRERTVEEVTQVAFSAYTMGAAANGPDDAVVSLRRMARECADRILSAPPVQGEPLRQSHTWNPTRETGATAPVQGERVEGEEGS